MIQIQDVDLSDMKRFVMNPIAKNKTLHLTIVRNWKGLKNMFNHVYDVMFSENRFFRILSAKKMPKNKSTNIILTLTKQNFKWRSNNCLGKLKSNFTGTQFTMYDNGENPKLKTKHNWL